MTIEIALLISIISVGFGVYQGISNMKRNKSTDDKKEANEMTTVLVQIQDGILGELEVQEVKDWQQPVMMQVQYRQK